jgi:hypothetical protein
MVWYAFSNEVLKRTTPNPGLRGRFSRKDGVLGQHTKESKFSKDLAL